MTPPSATTDFDRAAAVRAAMRTLVARNGLHGASMSAVAQQASVATGTAYVHYASKEQLILATYLEVKRELGAAAVAQVDLAASPHTRFLHLWRAIHDHLAADPDRARFLVQIDGSPMATVAHARSMEAEGDPIMAVAAAADMRAALADLDLEILYDLGIGPAVRLAARIDDDQPAADDATLRVVAEACWRASTTR